MCLGWRVNGSCCAWMFSTMSALLLGDLKLLRGRRRLWRWSVGIELAQDKRGRLMHKQWVTGSVRDFAQKRLALERRVPLQRGCSPVWPADRGMCSAGSPCSTRRPYLSGPRGSRSCVTVSLEMSSSYVTAVVTSRRRDRLSPIVFHRMAEWKYTQLVVWHPGVPCRVFGAGQGPVLLYLRKR